MKRDDKGVYKRQWKNAKGKIVTGDTWTIEWFEGENKRRETTKSKNKSAAIKLRAIKIAEYEKSEKLAKAKLRGEIKFDEFVQTNYLPKVFARKIAYCLDQYKPDLLASISKMLPLEEFEKQASRLNKVSLTRKLTVEIIQCLKDVCQVIVDSDAARTAINAVTDPLVREVLLIMRFKMMELRSRVDVYRLVSKEFGGILLSKIAGDDIMEYRATLEDEGLAASTRNKRCGFIKHVFTIAKDLKYVSGEKLLDVRRDSQEEENNERLIETTVEERKKILEIALKSPYLWELMCFSIYSGLRRNRVFRLRWDQVFLDEEVPFYSISRDKNGESNRVPFSPQAIEVLNARLQVKSDFIPWVFYNPQTNKPYDNVDKAFQSVVTEAGRPDIRWHDLRHIFCTLVADTGVGLYDLMSVSGHKDPKMAMRYINREIKNRQRIVANLQ